jgi:hypothetical protein
VRASIAILTVPLTVAVQRIKKPFIYAGFENLTTDGHGGNPGWFRKGTGVLKI